MISDLIFFLRLDTGPGFRVSLFGETFRAEGVGQTVTDFWMKGCKEFVLV